MSRYNRQKRKHNRAKIGGCSLSHPPSYMSTMEYQLEAADRAAEQAAQATGRSKEDILGTAGYLDAWNAWRSA